VRKIAVLFFATVFLNPFAIAYDVNEVMDHLQRKERLLDKVKFDFKQEIEFLQMNKKTKVEGSAVFSSTGQMRIDKTFPEKQLTVSDGKKLWVYNPAYRQVWEGTWKGWVASSMLPKGMVPVGKYAADLQKNFVVSMGNDASSSPNEIRIKAEPKNKDLGYSLEFVISTDSWLPTETSYISDSAKVVTLVSNLEENPTLPSNVFQFKKPANVDVIPMN
jgi:outer membrane lipoprotein-sorting protein